MSVYAIALFQAEYVPDSDTKIYTSDGKTIIDSFIATNTDSSDRTFSIYLVPANQTPMPQFLILLNKKVKAGESLKITEAINHILENQGTIYVSADSPDKIVIRASGRLIQ